MNNVALILAAGEHRRWKGSIPKQLVDIGEIPLIVRTIRQVQALDVPVVVVTHQPEITRTVNGVGGATVYVPAARRFTVETLLHTKALWATQTIILLGDVLYSMESLEKLTEAPERLTVIKNSTDLLALTWTRAQNPLVELALTRAIQASEKGLTGGRLFGFLGIYRANDPTEIIHFADPLLRDFDHLQDYEMFLKVYGHLFNQSGE